MATKKSRSQIRHKTVKKVKSTSNRKSDNAKEVVSDNSFKSSLSRLKIILKTHKLVSFFVAFLFIVLVIFTLNKVFDWENRRNINSERVVVTEIAGALKQISGESLRIDQQCLASAFSGVYGSSGGGISCGLFFRSERAIPLDKIADIFRSYKNFKSIDTGNEGVLIYQSGITKCSFTTIVGTSGDCLIRVRQGNEGFARNLFSDEPIN